MAPEVHLKPERGPLMRYLLHPSWFVPAVVPVLLSGYETMCTHYYIFKKLVAEVYTESDSIYVKMHTYINVQTWKMSE